MAKRISKRDFVSPRTAYRGGAILMAVPFVAIGTYFGLAGFGFLTMPDGANAPLWVIGYIGLSFALAGLMVGVNGVRGVLNGRRAKALRRLRREKWFLDYDWEPHGITDRALARVGQSLGALFFLAVFLVPFNWWAWMSGEGPWMVKGIVGLFDLMLVVMAGSALYRIGQFLKYGYSRLRFRAFPYFLGDDLEVVFAPNRFDRLKFTLRFVEERNVQTGTGENRNTQLVSVETWSEEKTIEARRTEAEVRVAFVLPDDPELENSLSGQPVVKYWELKVEAETPGIDFATSFPLPVYAREEKAVACPA